MRREEEVEVVESSGNVLADLGFEHPEEELAKAQLVLAIARVMAERKMTQVKLAKALGIDQPAVSKLLRGRTEGYTTDRLMRILNQLGQDVEITVRPAATQSAEVGRVYVTEPFPLGLPSSGSGASAVPQSGHLVQEPRSKYTAQRPKKT